MLRVEVIIGLIASAVAIIGFMARAYANIRKARRVRRYGQELEVRSAEELRRLQQEMELAQEINARKREREDG